MKQGSLIVYTGDINIIQYTTANIVVTTPNILYPSNVPEFVNSIVESVNDGHQVVLYNNNDMVIRELNIIISAHRLSDEQKNILLTNYGISSSLDYRLVQCFLINNFKVKVEQQVDEFGINIPDIDYFIVRQNSIQDYIMFSSD